MPSERIIYADHNATTPCDPLVVAAMLPYFTSTFGNPSSLTHAQGREAAEAVARARTAVAEVIGARPGEVVFTSGATESNNIAIVGGARRAPQARRRVCVGAVEHASALAPAETLAQSGFEVVVLPVTPAGVLDVDAARRLINGSTFLVVCQLANNETGVIQPVADLVDVAHRAGAHVHTDATQALGKLPVDVAQLGVDSAAFSAHKLYGPKGVGALYIAGGPRSPWIAPIAAGGGQERGLRPGTLNVPGIVGFGTACGLVVANPDATGARLQSLREQFEMELRSRVPEVRFLGSDVVRLPNTSLVYTAGVDGDIVIARSQAVCIGRGSACKTGVEEPSHVLLAMGLAISEARSVVRVSFGRSSDADDPRRVAEVIASAIISGRALEQTASAAPS